MRVDRGCWTSFFSGPWIGLTLVVTLAVMASPGVAQSNGGANPAGREFVAINAAPEFLEIPEFIGAPEFLAISSGDELPDAPRPQEQQPEPSRKPLMAAGPTAVPATTSMPMAPMYSRVIPAGMAAPQIHGRDKIVLATRDLYSLTSVADFFVSAGWDQLTNGQPNYGTNGKAFMQRVGAAAARDSSQAFLSNGPFAVMLHQDPRYFALGSHYSIARRAWYAITRPLVTRDSTDGHAVMNTSLILGQAAGTALNNLYYPKINRNFHDNLAGFGGSMGGCALSFAVDEFTSDLLRAIRLKHGPSAP